MPDITKEQVIDYLGSLPVIEMAALVKELEDKWGVSAAPVVQGGGGGPEKAPVEEAQTEFDVELTSFGESKINVIKTVRALTSLGLKEAKDLVEKTPTILLEAQGKEAAEEAKTKLEEAGAKVTLK